MTGANGMRPRSSEQARALVHWIDTRPSLSLRMSMPSGCCRRHKIVSWQYRSDTGAMGLRRARNNRALPCMSMLFRDVCTGQNSSVNPQT
jgi:hypothetical protein